MPVMETKLFPPLPLHSLVLPFQLLLLLGNLLSSSSSSQQTAKCHEQEKLSLLQFKESFIIKKSAIYVDFSAEPYYACDMMDDSKVATWTATEDCCSWRGVACDSRTGQVIGLDLSCSWLYGSINSSSSLFNLVHLRRLNLTGNYFNFSQIPSGVGNLSKLKVLDLSTSFFSGGIPSEISKLSKLVYLDLCCNYDYLNHRNMLTLTNPNLISFVRNLTSLQVLSLDYTDILSPVPRAISNLTSLQDLSFRSCGMSGEFPSEIFHLPKLSYLDLQSNLDLTGHLPDFHSSSSLQTLYLVETSFGGQLPNSIGNLNSLLYMDIRESKFSGFIPPSFSNLTNLLGLGLSHNSFTGNIPSTFANLTQLSDLDIGFNKFHGPLPSFFSSLTNLEYVGLQSNNLNGNLDLNLFWKLQNLYGLDVSYNNFSLQTLPASNLTLPSIQTLGIASCNLNHFPSFLGSLVDDLQWLDISANSISTPLPETFWNTSFKNLAHMNLSHNALTGELSPSICELKSLKVLDLSHNAFEGSLPKCFGSLSQYLTTLRLKNNSFIGALPELYRKSCSLVEIDLSDNLFHGEMPRTWRSCTNLEYVDLSYNQISDNFPYWLGSLPSLKILLLRSNAFHGTIGKPEKNFAFLNLHIIDLSVNDFSGTLPSEYFKLWIPMKIDNMEKLHYERSNITWVDNKYFYKESFPFSVNIYNKGIQTAYENIQNFYYLMAIDFSSNRFVGSIPESTSELVGLCVLNISNNMLSGSIPSSLSNVKALQSLDLSHNNLSGMIPPPLTDLTFLSFFDVSHNHLVGSIPHGKQFDTFQSSSFEGNPGLCGNPLPKKCETSKESPPLPSSFDDNQDNPGLFQFDWIVVLMGYASGIVIGLVVGGILIDIRRTRRSTRIIGSSCMVRRKGIRLFLLF